MSAGILLTIAIAIEIVGTVLLRVSDGLSRLWPSAGVLVTYALSIALLAHVLKELDVGFTYAVWAGVGTAMVAMIGFVVWDEPMGVVKVLSIAAVIVGVVGLNLSSAH